MTLTGKNAVVLGLGHSGQAAAMLLRRDGASVTVCESSENEALRTKAATLATSDIRVLLGEAADTDPAIYDVAVISPGIDPAVPLAQNVVRKGIPVIGELELAFEHCPCPVVAITGTNGKTTTTEITAKMLNGSGLRTIACGNIGLPFSAAVAESKNLDVMTLEVSSFQLEAIEEFRPKVAAWLNLSANHLDRYRDVGEYRTAKLRIFENQTADDFAVVNSRDTLPPLAAKKITFSAFEPGADFSLEGTRIQYHGSTVLDMAETRLSGTHNAENLMAALGIGMALGLDFDKMAASIPDYTAPAHRCEWVRDLDGVAWINDSKSTNLDAMEKAIVSQDRPIVLIAGGKDKGFEFDGIATLAREKVKAAVLIGEMKDRIEKSWEGVTSRKAATLGEAVSAAREFAEPGDVVLFSPGTSSFDMFRSYIERGNLFKQHVNELHNQSH